MHNLVVSVTLALHTLTSHHMAVISTPATDDSSDSRWDVQFISRQPGEEGCLHSQVNASHADMYILLLHLVAMYYLQALVRSAETVLTSAAWRTQTLWLTLNRCCLCQRNVHRNGIP